MKRLFLRLTLLCGLLAAFAAAAGIPGSGTAAPSKYAGLIREAEANDSVQVVVELKSLQDRRVVMARLKGLGAHTVVRYHSVPYLTLDVSPEALGALIASPDVVAIQENRPEPPALDSTIPLIQADQTTALGFDGAGIAVAILDTGIDEDHPFYGNPSRLVSEACYSNSGGGGSGTTLCPGGGTSQTGAGSANSEIVNCMNGGSNMCAHGSHVAGIAAGNGTGVSGAPKQGVAPGASIIAVQVFTRFNSSSDCSPNPAPCILSYPSDQISGLQRVHDLRVSFTIAAANMSLGGGSKQTSACDGDSRKSAIDTLIGDGIATAIAAGNSGFTDGVETPGCISTAVTVGATDDSDNVASFSDRGTLLDLFAPGVSVDSSVPDDTYANFQGTSMATPHVTGAFAVLKQAYTSASVATLLGYLQSTGVTITYASGGGNVSTPRINLLAALQAGNTPPSVSADNASVTVDEGSTATNTGTFSDPDSSLSKVKLSASVGTVIKSGAGTWSWSFDTNDGPTQSQTVTITATDDKAESGTVSFPLTVNNVPPSVLFDPSQVKSIDEGNTLNVLANFSDPGWADTYTSLITYGTPAGDSEPGTLTVITNGPPVDAGTVTGSHQYGDNGTFTVTAKVTDDDGGFTTDSFPLTVHNVNPTAAINETGTVLINGVPTFIAHAGETVPFSGHSTDPGSDDLTLDWSWGDGPPAPDVSTFYPNDPIFFPFGDPFPSPDVHARDVTDNQPHAFGDACFYTVGFASTDDDLGSASDTVKVIIAGNASVRQNAGYWQTQYRPRPTAFSEAQRQCYLEIAGFMSLVFNEVTDASTVPKAFTVLFVGGNGGSPTQQLDRQLLTAWLNFANGAFDLGTLVDTNGDGIPDTTFSNVMATAESVRLNPASTADQLRAQKAILERING